MKAPSLEKVATEQKQNAIESLKLKVDDCQAHYLKAGSGPAIVLLHGGASDSRDWLSTMPGLSHRYRLYAPDLIGYGESDKTKSGYYLSDFTEFTTEFMQTLGLDSPVLVGHSFGGRIALEIALKHAERVSRLVLIDTMGFGRMSRYGSILSTLAWGIRKLRRQPQPYPTLLMGDAESRDWVCLNELSHLDVPTLIVWKRCDPYFPLALATRAKGLIPGARLTVVPGYGHAPHKQEKSPFDALLLDYLDHDATSQANPAS